MSDDNTIRELPKPVRFGFIGLGMGLLIWFLAMVPPFNHIVDTFEARTYDLRARLTMEDRGDQKIEEVVIVDVDGRAISKLGRYQQWSRSYWVRLLDVLKRDQAIAVAFDILFD
ncbi:CHASE2 domain-containing protein, partial [bacterium]|nr:CHASE2 domain-containing protein [bacterium]